MTDRLRPGISRGGGSCPAVLLPNRSDIPQGRPAAGLAGAIAVAVCCLLVAMLASGQAGEPAQLLKAIDTLGRDISGQGQTLKPQAGSARPLLVQVLDEAGAPCAGAEVLFRVEPSPAPDGQFYQNGSLIPMQRPGGGGPPLPPDCRGTQGATELVLRSDQQGYAGVNFCAGRDIELVGVSASLVARPATEVHFALRVIDPQWGLLLWAGLLGGLALFLFGMRQASHGLEQAAGHRLRHVLSLVTENRLLGLVMGILVTAVIQSSGATTVMVVSFTHAGLMHLGQTLAIILGADIGTTLTVQLIAFSLKEYSLFVVFIGFIAYSLPGRRYRAAGRSILGFGMIFFGMATMGNAMGPLRDHPAVRHILLASSQRPLLVLLVSLLFTGLIQSSAATIGLALTFAFEGLIDLRTAIPVIFGANIGTCVTAFLAALGTRREAQRVAWAHILFKVLAVLAFLPLVGPFTALVRLTSSDLPRQIANAHTIFNVGAALIFLPFLPAADRLLRRLVPDKLTEEAQEMAPKYLDDRILETPVLALAQGCREISRMGDVVLAMLREGQRAIEERSASRMNRAIAMDDQVDALDTALRRYLTRLGRSEMIEAQAAKVASLLYLVHHLETIGDLVSKNLMAMARKVIEQDLRFSAAGFRQWKEFYDRNVDLLEKALAAFATNDKAMAHEVVRTKDEMSRLARNLHFRHLERLGSGIPETQETSDIHIHLISDLRRILSNTVSIAAAVVNDYRLPDVPTDFIVHHREG